MSFMLFGSLINPSGAGAQKCLDSRHSFGEVVTASELNGVTRWQYRCTQSSQIPFKSVVIECVCNFTFDSKNNAL